MPTAEQVQKFAEANNCEAEVVAGKIVAKGGAKIQPPAKEEKVAPVAAPVEPAAVKKPKVAKADTPAPAAPEEPALNAAEEKKAAASG